MEQFAKPVGEPIMQHGPFVMNTKEEIYQAVRDFQERRLAVYDCGVLVARISGSRKPGRVLFDPLRRRCFRSQSAPFCTLDFIPVVLDIPHLLHHACSVCIILVQELNPDILVAFELRAPGNASLSLERGTQERDAYLHNITRRKLAAATKGESARAQIQGVVFGVLGLAARFNLDLNVRGVAIESSHLSCTQKVGVHVL